MTSKQLANEYAQGKRNVAVAYKKNHKIDDSGVKEFGGPLGTLLVMTGFPIIMWYLWVGIEYYNFQLPLPRDGQSITDFVAEVYGYVVKVRTRAGI